MDFEPGLREVLPAGAPVVAVLGRDVQNHTRFLFDGPAGTVGPP
ncbi:MAG: hypothetical protein ACKVVT_16045 [Dehalococcoidia bacterium]